MHHDSGERHECRIPLTRPAPPPQTTWPIAFDTEIRSTSTSWNGDHGPLADQLTRLGIALVHDCGSEPGTVVEIGNAIGFVRTTNYGGLFDVVAEPDPINLAYTPLGLPAHTDNPYRRPCPTVQLLHCLVAAEEGGASRFVDGFAAAEALRTQDPIAFRILTSVDVTFRFHGDGVDLQAQRPIIELDPGRRRPRGECQQPVDGAAGLGRRPRGGFYRAYGAFVALLDGETHAIELTLRPGELVAFDNRRVLHGRLAFRATARRHLQGCYIDIDAVRSAATVAADVRSLIDD